jgi:hypothetical protein
MRPDDGIREAVQKAADLVALAEVLQRLFNSGVSVWTDGTLYFIRQRVGTIGSLKLEVFPRDHMPPHFHVVGPDINASYDLADCTLLAGRLDGKDERLLKWFFLNGGRDKLQAAWDATRPTA